MKNQSCVGCMRALLEENDRVPSYGEFSRACPPRQALILKNHGISRALLQLFPPARCMLPLACTTRNTVQMLLLPHHPGSSAPLSQFKK